MVTKVPLMKKNSVVFQACAGVKNSSIEWDLGSNDVLKGKFCSVQ